MLVLGVDPGFTIAGFRLVEADRGRQRLAQCDAITTPAGEPLPARLRQIAGDMGLLLVQLQPQAMVMEGLFFNNNITTGIDVAQTRGALLLAAGRRGVPIFECTPSQVKQMVMGYGKTEKQQVVDMTRRPLNLSAVPKPDDTTDMTTTALRHAHSFISRLQSPDAAHPGGERYEMRKQVRQRRQKRRFII